MQQKIEDINDAERDWISSSLESAARFAKAFSPEDAGRPIDPGVLDRTFAAWLLTNETDGQRINDAINAIGLAFGQLMVDGLGFRWVVATDEQSCEMAILALPSAGDVLIYPTHVVAKRWHTRETHFMEGFYQFIAEKVRELKESGGAIRDPENWTVH